MHKYLALLVVLASFCAHGEDPDAKSELFAFPILDLSDSALAGSFGTPNRLTQSQIKGSALIRSLQLATQNKTRPNAQLTVVFDVSGSNQFSQTTHSGIEFIANAVLKQAYPDTEIEYVAVVFDTSHTIGVENDARVRQRLIHGGGSNYRKAFYGARVATYLNNAVDHYILIVGDFFDVLTPEIIRDLAYLDTVTTKTILVNTSRTTEGLGRSLQLFAPTYKNVDFIEYTTACERLLN